MAKYQKYAEYKDSGVKELGSIPIDWNVSRIKYLTKCLDGQRIPLNGVERGDKKGNIPYWGANKIVDFIDDWLFDEELILLGEDGAPFFDKLKDVAFAVNGKIWPNNHVHVLRPFKKLVNTKFLTYALNCTDYSLYISGSTRDKLNQSDMDNILIRLPSLNEQTQIANFLDNETAKIDTLIAKQQKLIELLKEKRQAVISHAVTKGLNPNVAMKDSGVEWLGQVPEHWTVKPNKYLLDFVTSGSRGWAQFYADTGSLFFRIANLTRDTIEPKLESLQFVEPPQGSEGERSTIKIGDLLISITADLGSVCVADSSIQNGYVSQHVALCRPQKLYNSRWLAYYILSDSAKEQLLGSGYGGTKIQLSLEDIKELVIAVPPKEEQILIANYIDEKLNQFEHLIKQANKLVMTLQERRTALISSAVTGKIDVRNWQHPNEAKTELSL